jgi:hypothetical protein
VIQYAQCIRGRIPVTVPPDWKPPQLTADEHAKIAEALKTLKDACVHKRAGTNAGDPLRQMGEKAYEQLTSAVAAETDPAGMEFRDQCNALLNAIGRKLNPDAVETFHGLWSQFHEGDMALVNKAMAEAECFPGQDPATATAKNGYLFRVLREHGDAAGRKSYVANGHMTLGNAILAFPKEYGVTGRVCWLASFNGKAPRGTLTFYRRDFESKEATHAFTITCKSFDPTPEWSQPQFISKRSELEFSGLQAQKIDVGLNAEQKKMFDELLSLMVSYSKLHGTRKFGISDASPASRQELLLRFGDPGEQWGALQWRRLPDVLEQVRNLVNEKPAQDALPQQHTSGVGNDF